MNIERETIKDSDGNFVTTMKVVASPSEQQTMLKLVADIRNLMGVSKLGDIETFDHSAMLILTTARKALFCDAADLLEKAYTGVE